MRPHEHRRCPKCGCFMGVVPGSDKTTRDKVWFLLRCGTCGHRQMEWATRRDWREMGVQPW